MEKEKYTEIKQKSSHDTQQVAVCLKVNLVKTLRRNPNQRQKVWGSFDVEHVSCCSCLLNGREKKKLHVNYVNYV